MNIFQAAGKFFRRIWPGRTPAPQLTPAQAARLCELAEKAREDELNCEEVYVLIDQYAECVARGDDAAALMPLVRQHLEHCPGCEEEFQALLRMINE